MCHLHSLNAIAFCRWNFHWALDDVKTASIRFSIHSFRDWLAISINSMQFQISCCFRSYGVTHFCVWILRWPESEAMHSQLHHFSFSLYSLNFLYASAWAAHSKMNEQKAGQNPNEVLYWMVCDVVFLSSSSIYSWSIIVFVFFFLSFTVTMESTTILGAIFGLVALMLVFFLYINRKWCFNSTPGFPCCDETSLPSKYVHKMGKCVIAQNKIIIHQSAMLYGILLRNKYHTKQ